MSDRTIPKADISILLSFYKHTPSLQLAESIISVLKGSLLPKQIILISDGPMNPDSRTLLSYLQQHPLFTIVYHQENIGHARALNSGLHLCKSQYVLRLDPDDILTRDALYHHSLAHMRFPLADIFTADVLEVVSDTEYLNRSDCYLKKIPRSSTSVVGLLPYFNTINHPSVSFKVRSILDIGAYQSRPGFDDYDLWLRALNSHLIFHPISQYTVYMRRSSFTSRRHGLKYALAECRFFLSCLIHSSISFNHYLFSLIRIPLRLLPQQISNALYQLTRQPPTKLSLPFPWGPNHISDIHEHIKSIDHLLQRVS